MTFTTSIPYASHQRAMKTDRNAAQDSYRSIFMAAPAPSLLLRSDMPRYTIEAANEAFLQFCGVEADQLSGRGFFEFISAHSDERASDAIQELRQSFAQVVSSQKEHTLSVAKWPIYGVSIPAPGNEGPYWRPHSSPIFDEDGDVGCILHVVEDRTEQVLAEKERRRFSEVASDVLMKVGFDGYFTQVSSRSQAVLGWTQEEMMAVPWIEFVHPDDIAATREIMKRVLNAERVNQFENRYRCKDGSYRWLSWNSLTIAEKGVIYCAAGDVTQSRRLRSVAEGQKQALELSVQGALLPFILDRLIRTMEENVSSGVRASILLLSEDRQHLLTGAAPSLPDEYNNAIHGIPIEGKDGSCATAATTGKMYVAEDIATDPQWRNLKELALAHGLRACWSTPIFSNTGEVSGTLALYYDRPRRPSVNEQQLVGIISRTAGVVIDREQNLAARRTAERQIIKARNEAEAANIAKSEFLANMSHEIRTPMNVVVGVANILGQHETLNEEQSELVRTLQNSALSLLELIDDLLDISKIEANSLELELVSFRMERLIADVADMMQARAQAKGLEFIVDELSDLHGHYIGDPARLRQIILNLCSNAIKFTQSGSVGIRVSEAACDNPEITLVTISVTDTGIGIGESKQELIFQKFTQADSSINRKFGGTGLGLSITKQLVEAMEGSIEVKSKPGQGSTFTFTVPLRTDMAQRDRFIDNHPAKVLNEVTDEAKNKVLVVEDFEPNAMITGRYLRVFGYPYDVVNNGRDAVEKAKSGAYAVILMDVQMPELDGLEATRRIRAYQRAHALEPTPIIAVTAHALAGDRLRCLEAGMDDYLAKPFVAAELKEKLQQFT